MTDLSQRAKNVADARSAALANTPQARLSALQSMMQLRSKALDQLTGSKQKTQQLVSVLLARCSRQPELLTCDPLSLYIATQKIAAFGLNPLPERKHFYLVPYKNKDLGGRREAQLQVSWHGMVFMARSHPEIADVWAEVVYQGEQFSVDRFAGTIKHEVGLRSGLTADQLLAAYAVVRLRDGRHIFEVLSRDQVNKRRACARSQDFWSKWTEEMWKKTAVRALLSGERVPKVDGLAAALADEDDGGEVIAPAQFTVAEEPDAPLDDAGDSDADQGRDAGYVTGNGDDPSVGDEGLPARNEHGPSKEKAPKTLMCNQHLAKRLREAADAAGVMRLVDFIADQLGRTVKELTDLTAAEADDLVRKLEEIQTEPNS